MMAFLRPCLKYRADGCELFGWISIGSIMDSIDLPPTRIQQKVHHMLNCAIAHAAVVVILLLDVLVITVLLVMDLCLSEVSSDLCSNHTDNCWRYTKMQDTQSVISSIQLTVLSAFVLEVIVRVVVNVPYIRNDKWQVFDCCVVIVTFLFYTCLMAKVVWQTVAYSAAYIISLRLWRVGRLYYVLQYEIIKRVDIQVKAVSSYEEQLKKAHHKITLQKRQMERLEQAMLFFESVAYSRQANNRTGSLPVFSDAQTELANTAMDRASTQVAARSLVDNKTVPQSNVKSAYDNKQRQCLCDLDVPDILCNRHQGSPVQSKPDSLLSRETNPSYYNEAYLKENSSDDLFYPDHAPSSTWMQVQSDLSDISAPSAPSVLSQENCDNAVKEIESHDKVNFPLDNTRSYLSQDGIPMTDL